MRESGNIGMHLFKQVSGLFDVETFKGLLQYPTPVGMRCELANVTGEGLVDEFGAIIQGE